MSSNVVSMARMTHLVLLQMIQRKRGVIINIGSVGVQWAYIFARQLRSS